MIFNGFIGVIVWTGAYQAAFHGDYSLLFDVQLMSWHFEQSTYPMQLFPLLRFSSPFLNLSNIYKRCLAEW
jgi:hypothetical protein